MDDQTTHGGIPEMPALLCAQSDRSLSTPYYDLISPAVSALFGAQQEAFLSWLSKVSEKAKESRYLHPLRWVRARLGVAVET
jgi:hypothetical protein